jgi:hypothetical protein
MTFVEDYGSGFIDGITFAEAPEGGAAHWRAGPPFIGEETMLTPAQHFQRVMAERHGNRRGLSDTARTAHEQDHAPHAHGS